MNRLLQLALLAAGALQLTGCLIPGVWPLDDDDVEETAPEPFDDRPPGAPATTIPPSVSSVELPTWPPLGGSGQLKVNLTDDFGLDRVTLDFKNQVTRTLAGGTSESVIVTGGELGEGFGTLQIKVFDFEGAFASRGVTDLLVDLTPPKADLGKTVIRAAGDQLELWVSDAWVLGAVSLTFEGTTQQHVFDAIYPSTLGETWDYSLVKFASESLPVGKADAELMVMDAAGNISTQSFQLTVDGTSPLVSVQDPPAGSIVSGPFTIEVEASDAEGGPVWIDLELDGTPLASAVGPTAIVDVDASELTPGAATLVIHARDEAGNVATTELPIVVE